MKQKYFMSWDDDDDDDNMRGWDIASGNMVPVTL